MDSLKVAAIALFLTVVLFGGFYVYSNQTHSLNEGKVITNNDDSNVITSNNASVTPIDVKPLPVRNSKISVPLLAVDNTGKGKVTSIDITRIRSGSGKVLADVSGATIAAGTQESLVLAANAAGDLNPTTRISRVNSDLVFSFNTAGVREISGGSAGVALAVGTALLLNERGLKPSVLITGALYANGSVKPVGGVYEKVKAAKEQGFSLVLVPQGQGTQEVSFVNETQECRTLLTTNREECTVHRQLQSREVNLSKEFDIQVREVASVRDAYDLIVV